MNLDSKLIYRDPVTNRIDVQASLQSFAKQVIALKDEEKKVRTSRRYKTAIRKVFTDTNVARIPFQYLVQMAAMKMNLKPSQYGTVVSELEFHIRANRKGYIRIVPGKNGGVELSKP